MLIQVHYSDNRFDFVKDSMLHSLIESGAIERFKRSTGWVTVGLDPVRKFKRDSSHHTDFAFNPKPLDEVKNLVRVVYKDNRHDIVTEQNLVALIESGKIAKYMISNNWVTIGTELLPVDRFEHNLRDLN